MNSFYLLLSGSETGLLQPWAVWSLMMWLAVTLRYISEFLFFTWALSLSFDLENTHGPQHSLHNLLLGHHLKPGAQLLLATLLEDLFLVFFQPLPYNKLFTQFPIPAGVFPVLPNIMSPLQHPFMCYLSISALPRSTASVLYRPCHKIIHQQWEVDYSLTLLFTLGLET